MNEMRLEQMLQELATQIEYPPTPDLAFRVSHRLTRDPLAPERRPRRTWLRPALIAAALILLVGFFTLTFSPTARKAVADLLGVVGIEITVDPDAQAPPDAPTTVSGPLDLGRRVSVPAAYDRLDFTVKVPSTAATDGMGTAAYLDRSIGSTGMLSFAYPHDATDYSEVDLLITQFRASVDETFIKKISISGGKVRYVDVRGRTGYWVHGRPHLFYYVDDIGEFREESVRLAGNVLLWEEDGVTYRIEGPDSLEAALAIANSLR